MIPAQLSLLEPNATAAELRTRKERWIAALRAHVLVAYRGCRITTDDVWREMQIRPELRIPDGMSSNVLGRFFTGWPHAIKTGEYRRSERDGANANLLTVWHIR